MRKRILLAVVGVLLLSTVYWVATHSFVEIYVENTDSNSLSYRISTSSDEKISPVSTSSTRIKRLVSKSSYEILVKQANKSFFSVIKTGGFLGTARVNAKLEAEKSRVFVGDNPGSCMNYVDESLISYACNDFFSNAKIHLPASDSQPTYTENNFLTNLSGFIEGTIVTDEGTIMLVQKASPGEGQKSGEHIMFRLNGTLAVTDPVTLNGPRPNETYFAKSSGDGFIVYNSSLNHVLQYASIGSQPKTVAIEHPSTEKLTQYTVETRGGKILALYSSSADLNSDNAVSEAIISGDNGSNHFIFEGKGYSDAKFCGTDKLCLLGGKNSLDVYDISTDKAKLLFSVYKVSAVESSNGRIIVVKENEILSIDVDSQTGFIEYSLGDYKFNSFSKTVNGYVLGLTNNKNRGVAVYIDQRVIDTDGIDRKVASLQKLPEVSFISIYEKHIYVSAELGELVYDNSAKNYSYDPRAKKAAADKINQEIDKLGIDRSVYKISSNGF